MDSFESNTIFITYIHYKKIAILQLSYVTNFQLHATHITTKLHSCIRQVTHN
jgi:hypothetical protein